MRQNLARRMMVYVCGLLFLSCGVVMNARTGLGVAPISTVPYVMYAIEGLSLGTASFAVYCVFVVAQLCMVRYPDVKILMQIPVTLLFGALIDVLNIWLFPFTATGLVDGLIMLVLAVSFTTFGVTLIVSARLVPVAPDGMVQTLSQALHCEFGKAKYLFDGTCLCIALAYGLVRTGAVVGIGIGTVVAVFLSGGICTFWGRLLNRRLMAFMEEPANM